MSKGHSPAAGEAFAEAVGLHQQGRLDAAAARYEAALKAAPKHVEALHFLGLLRHAQGRFTDAAKLLRKALNQNPSSAELNNALGMTLTALGRPAEAAERYRKALALKPEDVRILNNLGNVLDDLGQVEDAMAQYRRALALDPTHADAAANLGLALAAARRYAEAIPFYEQALAANPKLVEAALNLGNACLALDRPADALQHYDRALALAPDLARAHNNRGRALEAMNRHEEAIACYEQAVSLAPDYAGAQWNLALARLALGDFARGWDGYEWRWRNGDLTPRQLPAPLWQGNETLAGKTIFVHAEQGFGDTLHFARYVPLLAARGARVVLEAQRPLLPLLASLTGVAALLAPGDALPAFDCHVPLLSLPRAFATRLDSIPAVVPYLAAPAERIAAWRRRIEPLPSPRIGLVWAGSAGNRNDRKRSLPLGTLLPLLQTPGASFVSLQKELRPGDAALLRRHPRVAAIGDDLANFADTAAVMAQLDLVIAVDTAPAHLAGALGRPVWILLPYSAEWRWLIGRETSPWYPSARLFRQSAPGDWPGLVKRVQAVLIEETRKRG